MHRGPSRLLEHEDRLRTRMGAAFVGRRAVFRGHDLHRDLGDIEWLELLCLGVTGRRFSANEVALINAMWAYTNYPDPRIWNNRIAGLAGTARSTGALAVSAAIAVSDAKIYGGESEIRALDFLARARHHRESGGDLGNFIKAELRQYRCIAGYGRPVAREDERIRPLMQKAAVLGLDSGPHVQLAWELNEHRSLRRRRMQMNYAALTAALFADMGFTPRQFYLAVTVVFTAGMLPCYIDAVDSAEGTFLPLRCDRIAYEGPPRRSWDSTKS